MNFVYPVEARLVALAGVAFFLLVLCIHGQSLATVALLAAHLRSAGLAPPSS
ncbi:MAG TPA: hypothetical protein VEF72_27680 [Mycobacterium sp.]|nr:hypothetical protein [Mycobacterium sp.]